MAQWLSTYTVLSDDPSYSQHPHQVAHKPSITPVPKVSVTLASVDTCSHMFIPIHRHILII